MQPKPIRTCETFTWRNVTARVTVIRNYRIEGWTLLKISVLTPRGAPLPFAIDGHLEHGIEQEKLDNAGGTTQYLEAWANPAAETPNFQHAVARWKQGDLFRP